MNRMNKNELNVMSMPAVSLFRCSVANTFYNFVSKNLINYKNILIMQIQLIIGVEIICKVKLNKKVSRHVETFSGVYD